MPVACRPTAIDPAEHLESMILSIPVRSWLTMF